MCLDPRKKCQVDECSVACRGPCRGACGVDVVEGAHAGFFWQLTDGSDRYQYHQLSKKNEKLAGGRVQLLVQLSSVKV